MDNSATSMGDSVTSTLQSKINKSDEKYVHIPSKEFLRPPLNQLGDSLNETKEHYVSNVFDEMTKLSFDSTKDPSVSFEKERAVSVACKYDLKGAESDYPTCFVVTVDGKEVTVMCSPMKLDGERVNIKHCSISDKNELINWPGKTGGKRPYKRHWGTSSTVPIPVRSATTTALLSQYWEVYAEIEPKELTDKPQARSPRKNAWGPLLEFGVVEESHADKRVWMCQGERFWCLTLEGCKTDRSFCARVRKEIRLEHEVPCHTEIITSTGKTLLKYGILVDVAQDMVAFIDLDKEIILGTGRTDFRESLLPTFTVKHITKNVYNIKLKLVSGADIDVTEKKKQLINECYQNLDSTSD